MEESRQECARIPPLRSELGDPIARDSLILKGSASERLFIFVQIAFRCGSLSWPRVDGCPAELHTYQT